MLDLALSILCSCTIFIIFRLYEIYQIQTTYAIVVNYFVACMVGLLFTKVDISLRTLIEKDWFAGTLTLGILFILVFNIMARTSQKLGISVASVATKMSLVIPVVCGLLLYNEKLGLFQVLGILLALAAVYLSSAGEAPGRIDKYPLLLPLLLFLGSGVIDASIKFMEARLADKEELSLFSAAVFGAAALAGVIYILIVRKKTPLRPNGRNVLGGIALGIPNYFSIYFLLRALGNHPLSSAVIFTINNVAIVMFSTLLGILLFREKLSPVNWGGVGLAVLSILLVALF